jgi:WD40 repeat protein
MEQVSRTLGPGLNDDSSPAIIAIYCRKFQRTAQPLHLIEEVSSWFASRFDVFRDAAIAGSGALTTSVRVERVEQQVGHAEPGAIVAGVAFTISGEPSARLAYERLIHKPLQALRASGWGGGVVIAIDALDESVDPSFHETVVTLVSDILQAPEGPGEGLRFLLSTRGDPRVLEYFGEPDLTLSDPGAENAEDSRGEGTAANLDDVAEYCRLRLSGLPQPAAGRLVRRVAKAAGANFLYARYVTEDILAHPSPPGDDSELPIPTGLEDQYRLFLQREIGRGDDMWETRYRPILGTLAVARGSGMSRRDLVRLTGMQDATIDDTLRRCAQYLAHDDAVERFTIYHASFRDYLSVKGRFYTYPHQVNAAIAARYLELWKGNWRACHDQYCLEHVVEHVLAAAAGSDADETMPRLQMDLDATLGDVQFLETKAALLDVGSVLGDFLGAETALPLLPPKVRALADAVRHQAHNLEGWQRDLRPTYFCQQVSNAAVAAGQDELAAEIRIALGQLRRPYVALRWRTDEDSTTLLRTLYGHTGVIQDIAITSDGRTAISASDDATLKVWDLTAGTERRTLVGHGDQVYCVALSPSGQIAFSGSQDHHVLVWEVASGEVFGALAGHSDGVLGVAFAAPMRLVSASLDKTLKVWSLENGEELRTLTGHQNAVQAVAVSSDGAHCVSGSWDGTAKIWDLESGQLVRTLDHKAASGAKTCLVYCVAVTRDGAHILTGGTDGAVRVWDARTGELQRKLKHRGPVLAMTLLPDRGEVATCSGDKTICGWDLDSGSLSWVLPSRGGAAFSVAAAGPNRLLSGAEDFNLKLWDLSQSARRGPMRHRGFAYTVAVSSDGNVGVSGSFDKTVRVWNLDAGEEIITIKGHTDRVTCVALTHDKQRVLSGDVDGQVGVWELETGRLTAVLDTGQSPVRAMALTADGGQVAIGCEDGTLTVWSLPGRDAVGQQIKCLLHQQGSRHGPVYQLQFADNDTLLVSAGGDGLVRAWSLNSPDMESVRLGMHGGEIYGLTLLSRDRVASGSQDRRVAIWDMREKDKAVWFNGFGDIVYRVAALAGGERLVGVARGYELRVIDCTTAAELLAMPLDGQPICIAAAREADRFLVGDEDGNIQCFDYVDTGADEASRESLQHPDAHRPIGRGAYKKRGGATSRRVTRVSYGKGMPW